MAKKKSLARRAKNHHRPDFEVMDREVDNPNWEPGKEGTAGIPRRHRAQVNIRESAISVLAAKGALKPDQVAAADRFRRLWEAMGGAGVRAIDWTQEAVDGGRTPDPISAFQIDAGRQLTLAFHALKERRGVDGYKLVCAVAGEGRSIRDMATTRRDRDTLTDNLRAGLDVLSEHWCFSGKAPAKRS